MRMAFLEKVWGKLFSDLQRRVSPQASFLYLSSVVGITSMSSKAWFSPPIAQMKV